MLNIAQSKQNIPLQPSCLTNRNEFVKQMKQNANSGLQYAILENQLYADDDKSAPDEHLKSIDCTKINKELVNQLLELDYDIENIENDDESIAYFKVNW